MEGFLLEHATAGVCLPADEVDEKGISTVTVAAAGMSEHDMSVIMTLGAFRA